MSELSSGSWNRTSLYRLMRLGGLPLNRPAMAEAFHHIASLSTPLQQGMAGDVRNTILDLMRCVKVNRYESWTPLSASCIHRCSFIKSGWHLYPSAPSNLQPAANC